MAGGTGGTGGMGTEGIQSVDSCGTLLSAERLSRKADAKAIPRASVVIATINHVDRRQLLGLGGKVTGAPGSNASSARARSAPLWYRRDESFSSARATTEASAGGTPGGSGAGSALNAAWPASISEAPGKPRFPETSS